MFCPVIANIYLIFIRLASALRYAEYIIYCTTAARGPLLFVVTAGAATNASGKVATVGQLHALRYRCRLYRLAKMPLKPFSIIVLSAGFARCDRAMKCRR